MQLVLQTLSQPLLLPSSSKRAFPPLVLESRVARLMLLLLLPLMPLRSKSPWTWHSRCGSTVRWLVLTGSL